MTTDSKRKKEKQDTEKQQQQNHSIIMAEKSANEWKALITEDLPCVQTIWISISD